MIENKPDETIEPDKITKMHKCAFPSCQSHISEGGPNLCPKHQMNASASPVFVECLNKISQLESVVDKHRTAKALYAFFYLRESK